MSFARLRYGFTTALILAALIGVSLALYFSMQGLSFDLHAGFLRTSMIGLFAFLVLLILRYFGLLWFSYLNYLDDGPQELFDTPRVSVLVPAFNEAPVIAASIRSLLQLDYPDLEILVIDDGSSDDTFARAAAFEGRHGTTQVRAIRKPNGGKADALNVGIAEARGSLILCVDADSALEPDTLQRAVRHFANPAIGAVAGNVKVINRDKLLGALQALEYIEGLNMVRNAQAFFRAVNIVPGPLGVFRRDALLEMGGYHHDTFAEDCDLTLRLLARGWQICYEPGAVAYTEAPEELMQLLKQRYRWTRGILQALRKHRRLLVDPRTSVSTTLSLWYMIFEGILWPMTNVFAHVLFIAMALTHGTALPLVVWWAQLTVLDMAAALYCVILERESILLVPYAILYRAFFALTIDVAKVFATFEEWFNVGMDWGKLERLGRI
jgi:cellulose synthase/poly-beta-1,6-N-acetylglucosamine synthase-like glycosyltransferase